MILKILRFHPNQLFWAEGWHISWYYKLDLIVSVQISNKTFQVFCSTKSLTINSCCNIVIKQSFCFRLKLTLFVVKKQRKNISSNLTPAQYFFFDFRCCDKTKLAQTFMHDVLTVKISASLEVTGCDWWTGTEPNQCRNNNSVIFLDCNKFLLQFHE